MTNKDFIEIKKADSNCLKALIGINRQCHNTSLFAALKVDSLEVKMLKDKLGFFTRLLDNYFTKKIIFELYECNKTNSYLKDVCTLLFQSDKTIQNSNLLILLANIEICKIDSKEKAKALLWIIYKENMVHHWLLIYNQIITNV